MNIFVNISHPAHVHFFKNAIRMLSDRGHEVITGARYKEFTVDLLNAYQVKHSILTRKGKGFLGLIKELAEQQMRISKILKENPIDIMLQINGIFNAPVGGYYGIPTLAFSDTENDKWVNRVSFSLSRHVFSPSCFENAVGGSWRNQIKYPGYHELAYLSPRYVREEIKPEKKFLVRFVGWTASHDIGEKGLSHDQKIEIVHCLRRYGTVHISSEGSLPDEIKDLTCKIHPHEIHDFMQTCKMVVGESATMASEAACLGVPAIFISNTGRGYTTEQDQKYGLIKHYRLDQWEEIMRRSKLWAGENLTEKWQERRWNMLKDKIEISDWLADLIGNYPKSIEEAQEGSFERYRIRCVG